MLKVFHIERSQSGEPDFFAPHFCCDICEKPITGERNGAYVFPLCRRDDPSPPAEAACYTVHKGSCHQKAERFLEADGYRPGWNELYELPRALEINLTDPILKGEH